MSGLLEHGDAGVVDRLAHRVRDLRSRRGLSLDALAARCGVSRSAISVIERGESSPTAVVLEKLAGGLDVPLASLFDLPDVDAGAGPVARRAEQPEWRDPESGYVRRNVSPPERCSPIQIAEVTFPAGAHVMYETIERATRVHEQIWLLDGAIEVTVGDEHHELHAGDCLALVLDRPIAFHNPHRDTARYAVVVACEPLGPR